MTHYRVPYQPLLAVLALSGTAFGALDVQISPTEAKPGDAILVTVGKAGTEPSGVLASRALSFYPSGASTFRAVAPLPLEQQPGNVPIKVTAPDPAHPEATTDVSKELRIVDPNFPSRELSVANKFLEPPANVKKRIAADAEAIAGAFAHPFSKPLFRSNFLWPRESEVTSQFGDRRLFNGKTESQHYGVDLAGKVGDPVSSTNSGVVVLARDCYHSGKTVLIHHGAGIFSAYFHLNSIKVRKGQNVRRGQPIGLVGKSGRVTGPHLHFGIKVAGLYVNPESVIRLNFD